MKLIGYTRVSKVGGRAGESFMSPDVQREQIAGMAAAGGHTVVEWVEDLDASGGSLERTGIERAFRMVEAGEAEGVAVAKIDRFSRSVVDAHRGVQRLRQAGGVFLSADLGVDTSKPMGRFYLTVVAAFAELERERHRETYAEANQRAMDRGVRSGGVPIGYERDSSGKLSPSEDADGVRRIFEMRAAGDSWAVISRELESTTGKTWGHSTMRRIVSNPVYLGELRRGEIVSPHQHEPLVDRATFEGAQGEPGVNRGRAGTLLGGLIQCASCGHRMAHESGGSRGYRGYRCFRLHAGVTCPTGGKIGAETAERYVTEQFLAWASTVRVEAETRTDDLDEALLRLARAEEELSGYVAAVSVADIGADAFRAGLDPRRLAVDSARSAVADARRSTSSVIGGRDVASIWDDLTTTERSRLLRSAITRVECTKATTRGRASRVEDRLTIVWADAPS